MWISGFRVMDFKSFSFRIAVVLFFPPPVVAVRFCFFLLSSTENSGSFHKMMCNDERRKNCTYSVKAHTSSENTFKTHTKIVIKINKRMESKRYRRAGKQTHTYTRARAPNVRK